MVGGCCRPSLHGTHGEQGADGFGLLLSFGLVVGECQKATERNQNAQGSQQSNGNGKGNRCDDNGKNAPDAIERSVVYHRYPCQDKGGCETGIVGV